MNLEPSTVRSQTSALERRLRQFYEMLNDNEFRKCFRNVDPVIRSDSSAMTEYQYENSLRQFIACYGCVRVLGVTLQLHVGEPSYYTPIATSQ